MNAIIRPWARLDLQEQEQAPPVLPLQRVPLRQPLAQSSEAYCLDILEHHHLLIFGMRHRRRRIPRARRQDQ